MAGHATVSSHHRICLEHQQPPAVRPANQASLIWPVSCKLLSGHAHQIGHCSPTGICVGQVAACGLIGFGQGQHWGLCNDSAVCEVACRCDVAEQVELDVLALVQKAEAAQHRLCQHAVQTGTGNVSTPYQQGDG